MNEWKKITFSNEVRAVINNAWSQTKWQELWRENFESWNELIKMSDRIVDQDRDLLIIENNVSIYEKNSNSNELDSDEKNSWKESWTINE